MKNHITKWSERFDAFSFRERVLIFAAFVVVLFIAWDSILLIPQEKKQQAVLTKMLGLNQQLAHLSDQVNSMSKELQSVKSTSIANRIDELQQLLSKLEQQQKNLTVEFIKPAQMAKVLRDMLNNDSKLSLTQLESLGVKPLLPVTAKTSQSADDGNTPTSSAVDQPRIYKHGVKIVFEGNFNSALKYLKALESMPWRFYWDNVEYKVLEHPVAQVTITVHTLSLHKGWIGV